MPSLSPTGGYLWPDGETRIIKPPSTLFGGGAVRTAAGLIDGRVISFAKIYRSQPWVAAAIDLQRKQIASLPLHTFRPSGDSSDAHRERLREHPLPALLNNPAPGRSAVDLKGAIALDLFVYGNHLERIIRPRAGATPQGLQRIDWRTVQPLLSENEMSILAWRIFPPEGGPAEILAPEDVLHLRWEGPDGPMGVSPLEQLEVTVRSENAAQRYAASSLRKGGLRGVGVLLNDKTATDATQRELISEEIRNKYSGVDRAFEPYVLTGVADIKSLQVQTAVEAELIKQRQINREEIAGVIGSPPVLIGDLTHATYSNVEAMARLLYTIVLRPSLTLISEQLNAQLIRPVPAWQSEGVWAEWSLDEVLKGDTLQRMTSYMIGRNAGRFTINDIRRRENERPFDHPLADQPLIQVNNTGSLELLDTVARLRDYSTPSGPSGHPNIDP
jgi:HK97 family phage portal protein